MLMKMASIEVEFDLLLEMLSIVSEATIFCGYFLLLGTFKLLGTFLLLGTLMAFEIKKLKFYRAVCMKLASRFFCFYVKVDLDAEIR